MWVWMCVICSLAGDQSAVLNFSSPATLMGKKWWMTDGCMDVMFLPQKQLWRWNWPCFYERQCSDHCFLLQLQRYIANEDSLDGERKDLKGRVATLESHSRQLELKTRNYADQSKCIILEEMWGAHKLSCRPLSNLVTMDGCCARGLMDGRQCFWTSLGNIVVATGTLHEL